MTTDEAIETLHHRHPELRIDWAGGVCPHQAEGSLLQWKRSREAVERWRAEDPEARALVIPDLGALLQWLMDDADRARAGR